MRPGQLVHRTAFVIGLAVAGLVVTRAQAESIQIAAVGASDLEGSHLQGQSWADVLGQLLRAKGYDVTVKVTARSGMSSDQILDTIRSVPTGTRVVVFSAGCVNDPNPSKAHCDSNIAALQAAARSKGAVAVQVFPNSLPAQDRQSDHIHPTAKGQAVLAQQALSKVIAALGH